MSDKYKDLINNVLILSAHCDDVPLSLGGCLLGDFFKCRPVVKIIFSVSRYVHKNEGSLTEEEISRLRQEEEKNAAKFANYDVEFINVKEVYSRYDFNDLKMVFHLHPVKEDPIYAHVKYLIFELLSKHDGLICSPLSIGNHMDHRIILKIMKEFLKKYPDKSILFYEDLPYSDLITKPRLEEILDDIKKITPLKSFLFTEFDINQKISLLKLFKSQLDDLQIKQVIHYWKSIGNGERIWLTEKANKILYNIKNKE